jgi:hypothetical protein
VSGRDFYADVAMGLVNGYTAVRQIGFAPNVGTGAVPYDVWSGGAAVYPWMTGATSLEVLSSSAADTAAGTGARTIFIQGLDVNLMPIGGPVAIGGGVRTGILVTMNGTTPVAIPNQFYRINSCLVATAGTGLKNAGNITIRDSGGGTTRAFMEAGFSKLRQSQYTVDANSTLIICATVHSIFDPSATKDCTVVGVQRYGGVEYQTLEESPDGQPAPLVIVPPYPIGPGSDIEFRLTTVSATLSITTAMNGVLRDNRIAVG